MTGLFLRYCPACNSATPCAEPGEECAECGTALMIVDAFALIPALGRKLTTLERHLLAKRSKGHDLPGA